MPTPAPPGTGHSSSSAISSSSPVNLTQNCHQQNQFTAPPGCLQFHRPTWSKEIKDISCNSDDLSDIKTWYDDFRSCLLSATQGKQILPKIENLTSTYGFHTVYFSYFITIFKVQTTYTVIYILTNIDILTTTLLHHHCLRLVTHTNTANLFICISLVYHLSIVIIFPPQFRFLYFNSSFSITNTNINIAVGPIFNPINLRNFYSYF